MANTRLHKSLFETRGRRLETYSRHRRAADFAGLLVVFALAEVAIFVAGGVQVGGNHAGLLPVVHRLLDPAYLPGDFGIELREHHHPIFAIAIASLARGFGIEGSLVILTHLGYFLLMWALWRLCRALALPTAAFVLVAAALATGSAFVGKGYEINEFLGNGPIMPPLFAHAAVLMSLTAAVHRRPVATLAWAGAVLLAHVQIGLIWLAVLAMAGAVMAIANGERPRPKALILGTLALATIGMPGLAELWAMWREGVVQGGGDTFSYIQLRMPHHFYPRGVRHLLWPLLYTLVLGLWLWRCPHLRSCDTRSALLLLSVALALILLSVAHAIDFHLVRSGLVSQVQFVRLTPLITVIGAAGLVALVMRSVPGRAAPWLWVFATLLMVPAALDRWQDTGVTPWQVVHPAEESGGWYDLCRWIRAHGPSDGLYVTPPGRTGFTALAERSTLVDFKINPDGARGRDAWYRRLRAVTGAPLPDRGSFGANKAALNQTYSDGIAGRLPALARRYGVRYAVLPLETEAAGRELYRNAEFRLIELPPEWRYARRAADGK